MRQRPASLEALYGLRARAWIRESTKKQFDRHGPASQRENIRRLCSRYDLALGEKEYVAAGSGTTIWKSAEMDRMIRDARAREFDVLVVGYFDRFQRNLYRTLEVLETHLHPAGVVLVMADAKLVSGDPRDYQEMKEKALEAEQYSHNLSERIADGKQAKRAELSDEGSGLLPFGFHRVTDDKVIAPNPATMPMAVRAWDLAAAGQTDQAVADALGLTLWRVRGILRSDLFLGRLNDGRPTAFAAPVAQEVATRAQEVRASRCKSGNRARTNRTYPLSGSGPAICVACRLPLKGDTKTRRDGTKVSVYRHTDRNVCKAWPVREVPAEVLERQVGQMLRGAKPDSGTVRRIERFLARPSVTNDRITVRRLQARLRELGTEMVSPTRSRPRNEITAEIEEVERDLNQAQSTLVERPTPTPSEAIAWLNDLGRLWDDTDNEGRRALAVAIFDELGITGGERRGSHRITSVKVSEDAEARGLLLALPTRLEVTMVGDTGFEPVTSRM